MDLFKAIESRRSIRSFHGTEIPGADLDRILEACDRAPSAGNLQAYEIRLIHDPALREALASAAYGQTFIAEAPVVLVFCTHPERGQRYGQRGTSLYSIQDASVAAAYAQLAAASLGLGTCWVGAFDEDQVARAVGVPPGQRPIIVLPIGAPAESPDMKPRRGVDDLVIRV